ncbi:hypothetical protein [Paenibacillus cisolokensis]|nr:hypothetical protein [Paenibacillus cisolokensis]
MNGNVVCGGLEQRVWSDSIVNGNVVYEGFARNSVVSDLILNVRVVNHGS